MVAVCWDLAETRNNQPTARADEQGASFLLTIGSCVSSLGIWLSVSLSCLETWAWGPVRPQGHGAGRQVSEALGPEAPPGLTVLPLPWGTCSLDPHPDGETHCPALSTKPWRAPFWRTAHQNETLARKPRLSEA